MFITRRHISRRTVLRGVGAAVALPFLDAMVPASTALASTAAAPRARLGFFYFPHSAIMEKWTPAKDGADFEVSPILEPLKPFRDYLTVVSNIGNKPGESRAVHALVPATWLSCVHPKESLSPYMAPTVDQIAARQIGQDTAWPSLEVATAQGHGQGSACERGFGCAYTSTLSFRNATTPLSHHANDPAKKARLSLIKRYHTKKFGDFLAKLSKMQEGDGTMLDQALFLYGSNMSNSNMHNQHPLHTVLVGKAAGKVRGGQHINFPKRTPLANVHLTMLQRTGVKIYTVGDSTGTITQL